MSVNELERMIIEFLSHHQKEFSGPALTAEFTNAIINLVNRGVIEVGLDWKLSTKQEER